jgi:hypothetical protein
MVVWFRAKKAMLLLVPKIMQAITTYIRGAKPPYDPSN